MEAGPPIPLELDNSFVRELPADPEPRNHRRQVREAAYSRVQPTRVARPTILAHSPEMAARLGLPPEAMESSELAEVLGGNRVLPGMDPYAACYGGHQFGSWAGQLGDGRAITLGEVIGRDGERWELQLKGAGPTPYSRTADGRAVMRSSVREFLCSEAMHHLGVPTTRALSLVATGETVVRDMFYDGNPKPEPGAVVCRVAPSFIRFGSFEIFAARGDRTVLEALAAHTLRRHFPHLGDPSPEAYARWLDEVCRRTAEMIVHWMRVGFVHGVMNTDNMSVLGLTLDYGPYGWLDGFDPDWTPNTTDAAGRRYRYGNQPGIALWNLTRFARALHPLIGSTEPLEAALKGYSDTFDEGQRVMWTHKLGLAEGLPEDEALLDELMTVLQLVETDMTIFFRRLADLEATEHAVKEASDAQLIAPLEDAYYAPTELTDAHRARIGAFLRRYLQRVIAEGTPHEARRERMHAVNPKYVLRNYLAQLAIDQAEQGDGSKVRELLDVLRRPYDEQPGAEALAAKRPEWARHRAGCSMLSCSS
ncbi:MAG: protein adenylyltransferase SelO [Myxococcota bacterium]